MPTPPTPPADRLLALADAIVTALGAASLGAGLPSFTAARRFLPILEMAKETPGSTFIRVVPVDDSEARIAAGTYQTDFLVRLFIQQKLPEKTTDEADDAIAQLLLELAAAIRNLFMAAALTVDGKHAWCIKAERKPAYDQDVLHHDREFLGQIALTWRIIA